MQEDEVENNQSRAQPSGDGSRDQSGPYEMQVEEQAIEASAQGTMRLAEAFLQCDTDTRARSSNEPMPDSGRNMNSIVTKEATRGENPIISERVGIRRSTESHHDLVPSKCEMMLKGQKLTLLIGESKCEESDQLNKSLKSLQLVFMMYDNSSAKGGTSCMRIQRIDPSHFMRSSLTSCQAKSMLHQ